ncbi:MAG: DEAD/DEAH box helicase [Aureispira sp.]
MDDNNINIDFILSSFPVFEEIYANSKYSYIEKLLTETPLSVDDQNRIIKYSFLIINKQLSFITKELKPKDTDAFKKVYYLLRSIDIQNYSTDFDKIWGIDNIPPSITYFYYLAVSGVLANSSIKTQVDLKEFETVNNDNSDNWGVRVLREILNVTIYLIRKNGINDIKKVIAVIENLKTLQKEFEEDYLNDYDVDLPEKEFEENAHNNYYVHSFQINAASNLLGSYHICKILTETASYLIEGYNYNKNLKAILNRHAQQAYSCLTAPRIKTIAKIGYLVCNKLYEDCIWTQTGVLGTNIQTLCKTINQRGIIDLLPSQQEAIKNNFLDPASSATILQMPTSAGKTLLAEFSILQTKALAPDAKVIYIVPTRALINQVLGDLRRDFKGLDLSIEKSSGAIELDPSEDLFLKSNIDILVITPEKLDLLIRKKHPSVEDLSLIVVDEAHNLNDPQRGSRLELLLAIIKRERPNARFLLLTPFIPKKENGLLIRDWLASGKNAIPPIMVSWKPADKIFLGVKEYTRKFKIDILPSLYGWDVKAGKVELPKPKLNTSKTKEKLIEFSAKHFTANGKNMLFLCRGKGSSDSRAKLLYDNLELPDKQSPKIDLVIKYIEEVIGEPTVLSKVLKKGIAVHHAGLTGEIKALVEYLIKEGEVNYICATTTVAQGMNFPISAVFFDSFLKGRHIKLSVSEFRNIAGRAGRTLVDNVGKIIFPFNSKTNITQAKKYLEEDAEEITSALLDLILSSEKIITAFSSDKGNNKERAILFNENEALSSLVQYIIHLLNILREDDSIQDLEELFKDSLGYHISNEADKKKFINICKTLYFSLQSSTSKGILTYADKTGFSVPSVLAILNAKSTDPNISDKKSWQPATLFNSNDLKPMTDKIAVVGHLREVKLGTESDKGSFNPEIIAKILVNWVNGATISELSKMHPYFRQQGDKRINEFISHLTQTTFKSSWGLSALEGIVKSNNDDIENTNSHIPSMVYYGVRQKESIALRMLGVPRIVADSIAQSIWQKAQKTPQSLNQVRNEIKNIEDKNWETIKPNHSTLSGKEWKTITNILLQ